MSEINIPVTELTHLSLQFLAKKYRVNQKDLVKLFVENGLTHYNSDLKELFNGGVAFSEYLERRKVAHRGDLATALSEFDPDEI